MKVAKHVKSNAIVLAKNKMTLGIGAGQMSRVVSTKIALMKAKEEGLDVLGCALASDAFSLLEIILILLQLLALSM